MDYEEKYKDLVKRLNKAREEKGVYTFNSVLDAVAPELKESEDERTWIINYLSNRILNSSIIAEKENLKRAIAWLEKQGEQNPVEPQQDMLSQEQYAKAVDECVYGEQKPAWSEDDEHYYGIIQYILNNECVGKTDKENAFNWLKSLKDRVLSQPKQKWGKEDSPYYDDICEILINILHSETANVNKDAIQKDLDWLKSRIPQNTWKPSDEQMEAVKDAIDYLGCNTKKVREYLMSLYEQLKKLREEL